MRIIAGTFKGATIYAPPGMRTRPTADKVRGAVFNMLGGVTDLSVLDLFAGSGALALEALSRGAAHAVLVESRVTALKTIARNVEKLTGQARPAQVDIRRRNWLAYLKFAAKKGLRFDLIFLDPPYRMHRVIGPELGRWIPAVVAPGARVVVESDSRQELVLPAALVRDKTYGDTRVRIFAFSESPPSEAGAPAS